jgi:hypothetical protein
MIAVAAAAAYIGRATWRSWRGGHVACGGCSCAKASSTPADTAKPTWISPDQLTRRLRNGGSS